MSTEIKINNANKHDEGGEGCVEAHRQSINEGRERRTRGREEGRNMVGKGGGAKKIKKEEGR